MKKMRTVKVKAGQEKLRERIKDALAQKGARAHISFGTLPSRSASSRTRRPRPKKPNRNARPPSGGRATLKPNEKGKRK